jgi:hypothetical protein
MKKLLLLGVILVIGCVHKPNKEVILNFESEIPITVTIEKSCEGNWNFCNVDNYNFKKWE